MSETSFLAELRRRRVLPVAGAYIAIAWLATEIASFLLQHAGAPSWSIRLLAIVFVVGFPIAVVLAWIIQVGSEGTRSFDRSTGQGKTVVGAVVLGIVATIGLGWLILPRFDDTSDARGYIPISNSLAILPLTTTGGTPNEQTVAETLYTVLLDGLDQSRELTQVRLRIEEHPADAVAFGREFRVAMLLLGRVLRAADTTQVELQLLDVTQAKISWSRTIDWDPTRIMEIGSEISDAVLREMDLPVVPRTQFVGTDSREAYEAYLLGRRHFAVGNAENFSISVGHFEQAVVLDPDFVRAHAQLASAYLVNGIFASTNSAEQQEWKEKARDTANVAVEIDSNSADAISVLARVTENPQLQAQLLERALELEPNHGLSLQRYALLVLRPAGRLEEAAAMLQRLLDIDPLDANYRSELGFTLWRLGHKEEAIVQVQRSIELQPDMMQNYHTLGYWMAVEYGRLDEAVLWHRKSYSVNPEIGREAGPVAQSYAALGMQKEALTFLDKALESMGWSPSAKFVAGHTHERLGDKDLAHHYNMQFVEAWGDRPHPEIPLMLVEDDVRAGRFGPGLRHFREKFPEFIADDVVVDDKILLGVYAYGRLLKEAGYLEDARLRFERIAEFTESACGEDDTKLLCRYAPWQVYAELGDKRKTLDWLRFSIVDKRYFANNQFLDTEALDFLRDDAEFQEIMAFLNAEMESQRARIRKLECDGEMPPAPGIDTSDFCP